MQRSKKQSYSITLGLSIAGRAVHRSESGHSMSELGLNSAGDNWGGPLARVRIALPAQPVDATQALNLSAGVSNAMVLRGRSFSWRATLFR